MQPVHAASDAPWIAARLGDGERLHRAYPWRSVLRAGIPLAFGSDFPVESPDPRAGLAAAEERAPAAERLGREEALRAYTAGAAYASFAEGRRGIVRAGMDADLTAFAGDLLGAPADELRAMPLAHVVVGGRLEWSAPAERG
jgi:predicted amidohydrolase YtcJ